MVLKTKWRACACQTSTLPLSYTSNSFTYLDNSYYILFVFSASSSSFQMISSCYTVMWAVKINHLLPADGNQVCLFAVTSKSNIQTHILLYAFFHAVVFYVYRDSHMWDHMIKDVYTLHIKGIVRLLYQKLIVLHTPAKHSNPFHFPSEKTGLPGGQTCWFLLAHVEQGDWALFKVRWKPKGNHKLFRPTWSTSHLHFYVATMSLIGVCKDRPRNSFSIWEAIVSLQRLLSIHVHAADLLQREGSASG